MLKLNQENRLMESPSTDSSLEHCLTRMGDGDKSALEEIYHHTRAAVYGYALSLLKNVHDAEDVLQECYLKLCSAAAAYRKQGKPMAFLLRIVRNLCYDRLRDRQRRESDLSSELAAMSAWPNLSEEDRVTLRACLEELRDEERQVILLHVLGGFRFHEIASFTEEPLSTVLSRYHRAMKKLRIQLS